MVDYAVLREMILTGRKVCSRAALNRQPDQLEKRVRKDREDLSRRNAELKKALDMARPRT